jgi:hypothetical protein
MSATVDAVAAEHPTTSPITRHNGEVPKRLSAQMPSATKAPTVQAIVIPSAANAATPGRSFGADGCSDSGFVNLGSDRGLQGSASDSRGDGAAARHGENYGSFVAEPPMEAVAVSSGGSSCSARRNPGWNQV